MLNMEIPECLVADILTRLPIKSILRFRAVCKSWHAFLPDPATHLFTVDPDDQILYKHHQNQTDEVFSLISFNNPDHITPPQKLPPVKRTADDSIGYTAIAGCCNGIVLLQAGMRICLWNPATGETKMLPEFKLFEAFGRTCRVVGLCFDAKTSDFKVILVFCPIEKKMVHVRDFAYSLRSDSWKIVEPHSPQAACYSINNEIAMNSSNGMCHWFGSYLLGLRYEEAILSFDANREIFITTTMPYKHQTSDGDRGFFMLKDYVAMSHRQFENWEDIYEIWAMLEVGEKESWIKVMSIGPTVPFRKILRFWTNRKVFLYTYDKLREEVVVVTFDTSTGQASPFLTSTRMPCIKLATNYKKSQVRLSELCAGAGKLH